MWRADANDLNASFLPVFDGTASATGLRFNEDSVEIAGSIPSCWVEGEGENTVLYTFDEDYVNNNTYTQGVYRYDIGNLVQPWAQGPSAVIYDNSNNLHQHGNSVIVPQNGGWWISQIRWQDSESVPSLIYVKNNRVLFNSGAIDPDMIKRSYSAAICLFDNGNKLAVSCYDNIKVFKVDFNDEGVPTLTQIFNVVPAFGTFCYSIAADAANNLYCAVDHQVDDINSANIGVIALPCENICETPAPSNQMITVEGGSFIPGDVNGDGEVTASDVTALFKYLLNNDTTDIVNGDQNGDGLITASDVTRIYEILLGHY